MKELISDLVMHRRYFHANPELGWMEYGTAVYISKELESLGYSVKRGAEFMDMSFAMGLPSKGCDKVAFKRARSLFSYDDLLPFKNNRTAVLAYMEGGYKNTVAFRFDMDALPILENGDDGHFPAEIGFVSSNVGVMHACGHDVHMAIGLGLARMISVNKKRLKSNVLFIFQPAEEGVRGANVIVNSGVLNNVDYIVSSHVWSNMPTGKIVCSQNGTFSTHKFDVVFRGQSAHAGICPEKGNNALLAASLATVKLHSLIKQFDENVRVNVGRIEGGKARNIIADYARIEIEFRSRNNDIEMALVRKANEIIEQASQSQNCTFEIIKQGEALGAKGTKELATFIRDCAIEIDYFSDVILEDEENRGCEDFTSMMNYVQMNGGNACFIGLGASLKDKAFSHHSPDFDIDESVMLPSVNLLFDLLQKISR